MISELTQDLDVLTALWSPVWFFFYYNCIKRNDTLLLNVEEYTRYTQYHVKLGFFFYFSRGIRGFSMEESVLSSYKDSLLFYLNEGKILRIVFSYLMLVMFQILSCEYLHCSFSFFSV